MTCGTDYAALKAGPEEMFSDELILISTDQRSINLRRQPYRYLTSLRYRRINRKCHGVQVLSEFYVQNSANCVTRWGRQANKINHNISNGKHRMRSSRHVDRHLLTRPSAEACVIIISSLFRSELYKTRNPYLHSENTKFFDIYFYTNSLHLHFTRHMQPVLIVSFATRCDSLGLNDNFRLARVLQASFLLCHYERTVYLFV